MSIRCTETFTGLKAQGLPFPHPFSPSLFLTSQSTQTHIEEMSRLHAEKHRIALDMTGAVGYGTAGTKFRYRATFCSARRLENR
jgi:hypothetical protein